MRKLLSFAIATAGIAIAGASVAGPHAATSSNHSQVHPWYFGGGINYGPITTDKVEGQFEGSPETIELDHRHPGGNLFLGRRINHYFGTEAGISYLGTDKYHTEKNAGVDKDEKLKNQWTLHMVGNAFLPLTKWFEPYAFGGVSYLYGLLEIKHKDNTPAESQRYSGFGLIYGAGLQFNYDRLGARLSYTRLNKSSANAQSGGDGAQSPQDYVSFDILYRFGG